MTDQNKDIGKTGTFTDEQLGRFLDEPDKNGSYFRNGQYDLNSREGAALLSGGFIDKTGYKIEGAIRPKGMLGHKGEEQQESRR